MVNQKIKNIKIKFKITASAFIAYHENKRQVRKSKRLQTQ
jgi:hypothetical protein